MHIYIFGNGNIAFDDFVAKYRAPLSTLVARDGVGFIVCDFRGADVLAMEYLKCTTPNVRVFHIGSQPRYLPDRFKTYVDSWELVGGFASDSERDAAASAACTHFLAHDANSTVGRKSGTLRNIERCLALGATRLEAG